MQNYLQTENDFAIMADAFKRKGLKKVIAKNIKLLIWNKLLEYAWPTPYRL